MTLAFSTHINGKPTYFVEKILKGIKDCTLDDLWQSDAKHALDIDVLDSCSPKLHTIRKDEKNRWKAGNNIHPVINNRTKDRFQFAPTLVCESVQEIAIKWFPEWDETPLGKQVFVFIDGELTTGDKLRNLAINDGFESVEAFFQWFKEDFKGKIISWVDIKY